MKNLLLCTALSITILAVASCSDRAVNTEESRLQHERDSLLILANTNQRDLERMTSFFDEVAACIDSVSKQETLLSAQIDIETNRRYSTRELTQRLNQLSEIINGQRERIANLIDSLNNRVDTVRTGGLRSTIAYLTSQLEQKEIQINHLKAEIGGQKRTISTLTDKVNSLTTEVGELSQQNSSLSQAVQIQTQIINEGYIFVASKDRLKEIGVIEGGGLFKKSKVDISKVTTSMCRKIDISKFNDLRINSKKIKLLTPAPADSYSIISQDGTSLLTISDATSFWSLSNILVIQTQ